MTSPYSSGGGGTHFEARVVASCLVAVISESPVRGQLGEYATEVKTQRAAFGDPLDDVIVIGTQADGRITKLDLQITTQLSFTENDEKWIEIIQKAWDTFSQPDFDPALHRNGVAIGVYSARADKYYQSILTWAAYSTSGDDFIERINKEDFSHKDRKAFVTTLRQVLKTYIQRDPTNDEIWRFLKVLVVLHFDFHSAGASRDESLVIDRLRGALPPDTRGRAGDLWSKLIEKAGVLIPVGGGATRASICAQLAQDGFTLGPAPSFWRDIAAIDRESERALGDLICHTSGLRLHRRDAYDQLRSALRDSRFLQIDGEPGSGKSALLKGLIEENRHNGPVFLLKDTRIHGGGWSSHAHVLGVSTDIEALLLEIGCAGEPVFFIDGIDKIVEPAVQLTVNDVLRAIAHREHLSSWRVVVTVREQNLKHLETWLDPDALKKLPIETIAVGPLDDNEIAIVAERFPRLRPLLNQAGAADLVLRRPFFLDALLRLTGASNTSLPATEVELLKLWWELGGSDRAAFAPAQHRRTSLLALADRLAHAPGAPISIRELSPEPLDELRSAGILRDHELGHSMVFTHDIYEEWALCELLISHQTDPAAFVSGAGEPDNLIRPMQLLGSYVLETGATPEPWQTLYANTGGTVSRPVWQRAVLTSSLQSTRATILLGQLTTYLTESQGERLKKLLLAIATTEVLPNPRFLDEKTTPYLNADDRARAATLAAIPKPLVWIRFIDWLVPQLSSLPPTLIPNLLPIFQTWQTNYGGFKVRGCREIGLVSSIWLSEYESPTTPLGNGDVRIPFGGVVEGSKIEESIRSVFLASAGDVPELVAAYLRRTSADPELRGDLREQIVKHSGALARHCATEFVDFFLSAYLKTPGEADIYDRHSDYMLRELGIDDHYEFYPASPVQLPFLNLLRANETEGLRLIRSLCNHSVSVWREVHEGRRRDERAATPLPLSLNMPWGSQTFWGNQNVYLWFRGVWGNKAVQSALMALEQWALEKAEANASFDEIFRQAVLGHESVAILGIAVSLCLAHPTRSTNSAFALVTCPHLWGWDIARVSLDSGSPTNEMGDWNRYAIQLQAVRALNRKQHRKYDIRHLLPYFVFSPDEALRERYTAAVRGFPDNLPFSYDEERTDAKHVEAMRERMRLFAEQADPANWKASPTADGEQTQIWNEPPSLKTQKYIEQQERHEQLGEYSTVAMWARRTLEEDRLDPRVSVADGVARVVAWDDPALFDARAMNELNEKQRAAAVAGAAFVAARHCPTAEWTPKLSQWCLDVLDRAAAGPEVESDLSSRGGALFMHPATFAAYGYSALLARGYETRHCQEALFSLAVDALQGVQNSVASSAGYYAATMPDFYWLLFDLLLRQCIVHQDQIPDFYSVSWSEPETDWKLALLARSEGFLHTGAVPPLPSIPVPWVQSGQAQRRARRDTRGYVRNDLVFLSNLADGFIKVAILAPLLNDPSRRLETLRLVSELLDWTIQETVPPFAKNRRDSGGSPPFEWIFEFSAWCGRLAAQLNAAEVRSMFLDRVLELDTDTALLIMQSFMRAFVIEAFLKEAALDEDHLALWGRISDWVFGSPKWTREWAREHIGREFAGCAFLLLFCFVSDFTSPLCGVDPDWPPLARFHSVIERAIREFGRNRVLYLAVTTFLKKGGFGLLPDPALAWLLEIVQATRQGAEFWLANGEDTVEVLKQLIAAETKVLTGEHRKSISLISDILIDNGVRGAGFLQQALVSRATGDRD
jgi:hypothetical protein